MPATYTHYSYGKKFLDCLTDEMRAAAEKYPDLYLVGLQGPDLLFFYRAISSNPVNKVGYDLHEQSGKVFFSRAAKAAAKGGEAALAYAAGTVCHYALDTACHGYIEKKTTTGVTHFAIEKEFDKYVMRKDGVAPFAFDIACGVKKSRETAAVLLPFYNDLGEGYPKISEKQLYDALKGFVFYNRAMQGRTAFMRGATRLLLKLSGKYDEMHTMLYEREDNPDCADSNLRLEKLCERAKVSCEKLAADFAAATAGGELSDAFLPTFGPCEGWENIPVLTPDEEIKYEI